VCGDVHKSGNGGIGSSFGNNRSSKAVCDEDARSVLQCEDALHRGHIILEGRLWFLDDADGEAVLDKVVVDTSPARTVLPCTVDEDYILHLGLLTL
jgi:hypothetical protein